MSIRRRIASVEGVAAVRAVLAGADDRTTVATASRYLLEQLADEAEGHTVEVRVPPFGAVQAVPGPRHTRGTPPNVVEMDAATWIALATGSLGWDQAIADLRVTASGQRATLAEHLPLRWETMEP
ncbi:sterol carrier family protein [Pseudolysinimonas yzui]|uniref:Bacterial SCP orthologue domain-containing protein n=1 Tax=Pseudolysinimonas yzui TaxID=2708254 RepID=A0A8J3M2A2_9MICO|nr:hypothetical protein GCM10011600_24310 [Pseudolysinimonas yzui]